MYVKIGARCSHSSIHLLALCIVYKTEKRECLAGVTDFFFVYIFSFLLTGVCVSLILHCWVNGQTDKLTFLPNRAIILKYSNINGLFLLTSRSILQPAKPHYPLLAYSHFLPKLIAHVVYNLFISVLDMVKHLLFIISLQFFFQLDFKRSHAIRELRVFGGKLQLFKTALYIAMK